MSIQTKETLLDSLRRMFASNQVVTNPLRLLTYAQDASLDRGKPEAVVFPLSTDEVVRLVQWAAERDHQVPLVARGAGTGLSGGAVPERGGVIVEFSRMNRVVELDEIGRSAVVEPGVVNSVLDELVKAKGLYYPPDPSSGRVATMGGNIAENAGGPHCLKYGVTTNYVTGLQVVLADGCLVRLGGRALDYPEYDFVGLMTGNEGTLGIVTEAAVRLIRNTLAIQTLMAAFDSVAVAGQAVSAIIAHGLVPATLELMDRKIMWIIEDFTHAGLPVDAEAALIIEVDGYPQSLSPQMDEITAILQEHNAHDLRLAQTAEERDHIWYARKSVGGAIARIAPAYYPVDGTVPRSKLGKTLEAINQICTALDLSVAYVLHAGDGNLHPHIFIDDPSDRALIARVLEAGRQVMDWCVKQGGSITGEHGVGIEKREGMLLMYSADELAVMQDIKQVFDLQHLLNPGKIFPAKIPTAVPLPAPSKPPISPFMPDSVQSAADALRAWFAADPPKSVRLRGGGTKSTLLPPTDVVLSTQSLQGIYTYAPEDLYVTVGAGTPLVELQNKLARDGMWVPLLSPWQASTVGGIVAANLNVPWRMRYGGIRDLVLAVTVALPNGRVIRAGRPVVKNVAGYDLTKLFVGSHGTLGLIGDVTFKITALPRARASLIVPLDDPKPGVLCGSQLMRVCLVASAVLLCHGCDVPGISAPYVLIYTAEGLKEDVASELVQAREILQSEGATEVVQSELSGSEIWAAQLGQVSASLTHTIMRIGIAPKDMRSALSDLGTLIGDASFIADFGNGQLYLGEVKNVEAVRQWACRMGGYAVVLSAPTSFPNGCDVWGYVPDSFDLMRALKAKWDTRGLLNPGAFLV